MSSAFQNFLTIVGPSLAVNEEMSILRIGIEPITPIDQLQMVLSGIAGYSFHPCRATAGVSKSALYSYA